eukprot:Nitzschia sp. Nitz4//scaffold99_size76975//32504//34201//NITZ4_005575-RA/size76975-snap-gene-0.2-mRNA-1//1//CDS//3329560847//9394//frame0
MVQCWAAGKGSHNASNNGDICSFGRIGERPAEASGQEEIDKANKLIAADLYELTPEQRDLVFHDIHGVADLVDEDPLLVQQSLQALEVQLAQTMHGCPSFQYAWERNRVYVQRQYLKFLRSEEFAVPETVERMYHHYQLKEELFGKEALAREIELSRDSDKTDMACLKAGFFQLLSERDHSGRVVLCKVLEKTSYKTSVNVYKTVWYLLSQASRDVETQRRGIISLIYAVCDNWVEKFDKVTFRGIDKLKRALPVRTTGVHYCYSDPTFGALVSFISAIFHRRSRVRSRLHRGTHTEVQYELMSFGIPTQSLPVTSNGTFRKKEYDTFIKSRLAEEKSPPSQSETMIVIPSRKDVLFGKGKTTQRRLGNMFFSSVLEERMNDYLAAPRSERVDIQQQVVERIRATGGRFLRQTDAGIWVEVDDAVANDKVGHGFRNRKPVASIPRSDAPITKRSVDSSPLSVLMASVSPSLPYQDDCISFIVQIALLDIRYYVLSIVICHK